jgi:hypothetical protein
MLSSKLSGKMATVVKQKIENISVDGKVDTKTVLKDSSIKTILSTLISDVQTSRKTKLDITNILQNNKEKFDIKGLSKDIKNVIDTLDKNIELKDDPKIKLLSKDLKSSLIDIKKIDGKVLKTNISNSGVFLESKISDISNNKNITDDLKKEIKFDVQKVLQKVVDIQQSKEKIDIKIIQTNNLTNDVDKIENKLKTNNIKNDITTNLKELITQAKNFLSDKTKPMNTKVIFENNKSTIKNITTDIKANILILNEHIDDIDTIDSGVKELKAAIEKIGTTIDFYQLLSYSASTPNIPISFLQDDIEDVDISFGTNEKNNFSCQINLNLKKYGEVKILLVLDNGIVLDINIGVVDDNFKKMLQSSLQVLRKNINKIGLSLSSLNIFDIDMQNNKTKELNVFLNDSSLDFGLDIKV